MTANFKNWILVLLLIALLCTACTAIPAQAITAAQPQITLTLPPTAVSSPQPEASATSPIMPEATQTPPQQTADSITEQPSPTTEPISPTRTPLAPEAWKELPVVPTISQSTMQIYQKGLEMGRDPHHFAKIGDCQNVSSYFLSAFEYPSAYRLGEYAYLAEAIEWFKGSFTRDSLAVKGGFNVAAVLSPARADPKQCEEDESPAACELRIHNPSFAIISMETWWAGKPENYEKYMRQLIEFLIEKGVVPILATKADNLEGEHQINQTLGQLAWEYDIPLWNFWASVQSLPDRGLTEDGFHLTLGNYYYDDPQSTQTGWSKRNLTALQALDAVWRGVTNQPIAQP